MWFPKGISASSDINSTKAYILHSYIPITTSSLVDCSKRVNETAVDEADPVWWVLFSGHIHVSVALDLSMVRSSSSDFSIYK